jgi:RHS repeat-associated protein
VRADVARDFRRWRALRPLSSSPGRRIRKVVANSGDLGGITVFYYDGQGIVETRDGSGNLVSQFVRGLRYIDEVVMVRVKDEGELYFHQAEGDQGGSPKDWNVVGLTDLGGRLVERYVYRPYGEVIVHQLGGYADYDGDGDADANDRGEITGLTCGGSNPSGACRVLDLDFDNDCDSSDETVFDALPHTGTVIHPARRSSLLGQPFAHQGLFLDSEIGSYQNRARQYGPGLRRFVQRDPLAFLAKAGGGYQDGASLFQYEISSPLNSLDPRGLFQSFVPHLPSPRTDCGQIACQCEHGDKTARVRAHQSLPAGVACMTLPWGIHCKDSCDDAEQYLSHECCHYCDLRRCPLWGGWGLRYVVRAIFDTCYDPQNQVPWRRL